MKTNKQANIEEEPGEDPHMPTAEDDYESDPDWHPPGAPEVRYQRTSKCIGYMITMDFWIRAVVDVFLFFVCTVVRWVLRGTNGT